MTQKGGCSGQEESGDHFPGGMPNRFGKGLLAVENLSGYRVPEYANQRIDGSPDFNGIVGHHSGENQGQGEEGGCESVSESDNQGQGRGGGGV